MENIEKDNQDTVVAEDGSALMTAFMTKDQREALKGKRPETVEPDQSKPTQPNESQNQDVSGKQQPDQSKETEDKKEPEKKDFEALYNQIVKESTTKDKRAEDNMRTARQLGRNLSAIKAHVAKLAQDAMIDEETLSSFNELLSKDVDISKVITPETPTADLPKHIAGIQDLAAKAKDVFEKYLELSPHAETERDHADGFDTAYHLMTDDEKKKLYDTLKSHEGSPRELLKAMLDVGVSFWDGSIGKGIKEHGSLLGIVDAQASKISKMEKVIAEYEKKQKVEKENDDSFASTLPANIRGRAGDLSPGEKLKRELAGLN